jgi:hypothetical protein
MWHYFRLLSEIGYFEHQNLPIETNQKYRFNPVRVSETKSLSLEDV